MDLAAVGTDVEKVIATEAELSAKIKELAALVDADYKDKQVLLVGVLKGAIMAMADLTRAMQTHIEMDWMAVSSYGSGTKSSGVVRILKDLDRDITGRHVLIVEDIVDSGLTLSWLKFWQFSVSLKLPKSTLTLNTSALIFRQSSLSDMDSTSMRSIATFHLLVCLPSTCTHKELHVFPSTPN